MKSKVHNTISPRPPVVVVMGHIDHGKSTLLDYIRKTNTVEYEAGGITQHISAYEASHKSKEGESHTITFLDTPGHESFSMMRLRGAEAADIGILVVSAEEGVKLQTVEAKTSLESKKLPYVVAITKIDSPKANVERTKQSLAENEIYLEGYGGSVPWVALSSKTGEGVPELLELVSLTAELAELTSRPSEQASGFVIETFLDPKRGISATLIVKEGALSYGEYVLTGDSLAPTRIMENFMGQKLSTARAGTPVKVTGFESLPIAGSQFRSFKSKYDAESARDTARTSRLEEKTEMETDLPSDKAVLALIIKADTAGSLEVVSNETIKTSTDAVRIRVVSEGVGAVNEKDVKFAQGIPGSVIVAFHTRVPAQVRDLALRSGILIHEFDIIYKLVDKVKELVSSRTPKVEVERALGTAKILRLFKRTKDRQIVGGRVLTGILAPNCEVKIMRRDAEIGRGRIRELESGRVKTAEVKKDVEFGALIESGIEIMEGDKIDAFRMVEQ